MIVSVGGGVFCVSIGGLGGRGDGLCMSGAHYKRRSGGREAVIVVGVC